MKKQSGFTLIELLLVIAIISLLGSIIISNLNSAKEKARVANLLQFSSSIYHSIGYAQLDNWGFDETGGATASDASGGRTLLLDTSNGPAAFGNAGVSINSLYVDGGGCYDDNKAITPTNELTVEAFFYPTEHPISMGTIVGEFDSFIDLRGFHIYTYENNQRVLCRLVNNSGDNLLLDSNGPGSYTLNKWHHVVCTYNGTQAKLYLNGKVIASSNFSGSVGSPVQPGVRIGNYPGMSSAFHGYIDRVMVYNESFE